MQAACYPGEVSWTGERTDLAPPKRGLWLRCVTTSADSESDMRDEIAVPTVVLCDGFIGLVVPDPTSIFPLVYILVCGVAKTV